MDLDLRAAARLLGLSQDEVFRLVEAGHLPHHVVQDRPRFDRLALLEYATRQRVAVSPDLFEDARPGGAGGERLRLSRLLGAGGVHRDLPGATPAALLGALVRAVPLPGVVDREAVAVLAEARGGLRPLGQGIAIPQARAPIAVAPHEPLLALGFAASPVPCGAPDGLPVQAAFLIVSPSIRVHLDALSKLGTALLDPLLLALLARRAAPEELLERLRDLEGAGEAA